MCVCVEMIVVGAKCVEVSLSGAECVCVCVCSCVCVGGEWSELK